MHLFQERNTLFLCMSELQVNIVCYTKFNKKYITKVLFHHKNLTKPLLPFSNKPCFLRVCSTSLLKTLWEKEKLLVTSNFSFSHSVFYLYGELSAIFTENEIVVCKLFQIGSVQNFSFGKGSR